MIWSEYLPLTVQLREDNNSMEKDGVLSYKGYTARPEYSAEDGVFYGRLLSIGDLVDFQSRNVSELESEFRKAVDGYLAFCKEIGKTPAKADKREAFNHLLSLFPKEGLDLDPEQVREE